MHDAVIGIPTWIVVEEQAISCLRAFYMCVYCRFLIDLMDIIRAWLAQFYDGEVVHASAVQEYVCIFTPDIHGMLHSRHVS